MDELDRDFENCTAKHWDWRAIHWPSVIAWVVFVVPALVLILLTWPSSGVFIGIFVVVTVWVIAAQFLFWKWLASWADKEE